MARHKKYSKGEGGGLPEVWVVVSFMNMCLLVVRSFVRAPKMFQLYTNKIIVWLVQVCVNN
jgi:hypothetical protein